MEQEVYEYDKHGRLKYHPDLHPRQGQPWTADELEYLCKYHDCEPMATTALALERAETSVASKLSYLKKNGRYAYHRRSNQYYNSVSLEVIQ